MSNVEERLQAAGRETRQLARTKLPNRIVHETTRARPRGWLAFAAAFAAVVVAFGLIPWLASNTPNAPVGNSSTPVPMITPSTTPVETTLSTGPVSSCRSQEVPDPAPMAGLPEAVAATRDAIIAAARACDFVALESLAADRFTTSFGGGGSENLSVFNDRGLEPTSTLLRLLNMGYATIPSGDGEIYVWPAAHTYGSWEQVTEEELDELSRIHTEGELDLFAGFGSYVGWRTGIDQEGNWLYFIAGD